MNHEPCKKFLSLAQRGVRAAALVAMACGPAGLGEAQAKAAKAAKALAAPTPHELTMPLEQHSLVTLAPDVGAVVRDGDRLIVLPRSETWGSVAPFHPDGATREAVFGKISAMARQPIYEAQVPDHAWMGADFSQGAGKRLLFLDGVNFSLFEVDPTSWKEVLRRSVAWDQPRPPRDRGGEGTTHETSALRARLVKAWRATGGLKVTGMAVLPEAWHAGAAKSRTYAVATRVPGFPLLLMECDKEDGSSCAVTRACPLGNGAAGSDKGPPAPETIAGIAVESHARRLLFGDRLGHRLLVYRFDSCEGSPRVGAYALPPKLKELGNFSTDSEGGLWIATRAADDYLNASVYWWPKGEW